MHLRVPRPLAPMGTLAVVAPASPPGRYVAVAGEETRFDDGELRRGLAWLSGQYRLVARSELLAREGYLAGTDGQRAIALGAAMLDDGVDAIACARGGYGAMRILDALPWDAFVRSPKWLFGFSDITALGLAALARGVATIHGPNVTSLPTARPRDRFLLSRMLRGHVDERVWSLRPLARGDASGRVVGGNLTLFHAMAVCSRIAYPEPRAILLFEDVTERPYRIDRMLTSLAMAGYFERVAAIVFGDFTDCAAGPDGFTIDEVLERFARAVPCPVFTGAPFGHGARNEPFIQGERVEIRNNELRFHGPRH